MPQEIYREPLAVWCPIVGVGLSTAYAWIAAGDPRAPRTVRIGKTRDVIESPAEYVLRVAAQQMRDADRERARRASAAERVAPVPVRTSAARRAKRAKRSAAVAVRQASADAEESPT